MSKPHAAATHQGGPANPDPFLTTDEAAEYLGVSRKFVLREIASSNITAARFGRMLRIRRSSLENYVAANGNQ